MLHASKTRSLLLLIAVLTMAVNAAMPTAVACNVGSDSACSTVRAEASCCDTGSCCCSSETSESCGCQSNPIPPEPVNETPISPSFGDQVLVLNSMSELAVQAPAKCRGTSHMAGVCPAVSGGLCVRNCVWQT